MIDFSTVPYYVYAIIAVGSIIILVVAVKLIMLFRKKKVSKTEKELKVMMQELKQQKKQELIKIKSSKIKAEKEVKEIEITDDLPKKAISFSFNPKGKLKFLTIAFWKNWVQETYFPAKLVMINMELINGFHRTFKVIEKDGGFIFRGKKYIFDDDSKYYNMDAKLYIFDFHENLVLPVKRKIPVTAIKKTVESTEEIDIEYAINPSTLQRFMTAKIAEGVMKGTLLDEFLRKLQMFIIVIMVTVLVHLALFIYGSGMLNNIQVPSF